MQKKLLGILLALFVVLSLAACGTSDKNPAGTKPAANIEEPAEKPADNKDSADQKVNPTGNTVEVTVNAKSFDFDKKEIKAHVGDTVKVHLVNTDGAHGFAIDEFGVDIKGGETSDFMVTKKGEYQYYCSLMCGVGHDKMIGKLIVE